MQSFDRKSAERLVYLINRVEWNSGIIGERLKCVYCESLWKLTVAEKVSQAEITVEGSRQICLCWAGRKAILYERIDYEDAFFLCVRSFQNGGAASGVN